MKKILIANRGEIAVRVIKTCKKLGISTVAIYSEADRLSSHVKLADEAYCVGPPASSDSYLQADKIIAICKETGVEGIHPGYGFLSENAGFVKKVQQAGIVFIGPSAESIELMGSKIASKQAVEKFGVPLVPGINSAIEDIATAKKIAEEIGYPILVKASAGGGGKGMRIVHKETELESQMKTAINEAMASFGDGAVFIEKFVQKPRHIEIQVLADNHGNIIHLLERECSIQRRHQKLIEEAPSSLLTEELRQEMGAAAVNVAKACNYSGAGTVEFLMDADGHFYFLEMNTRLQVEHPVTEMITGMDLVEQQIKVARGEKLEFQQEDIKAHGHAIELRLCAEDPMNDFLPALGMIIKYNIPKGDFIRVDDFVYEGYEIPIYYDNMFGKLIVWGEDRNQAIERMQQAINAFEIEGIANTLDFGRFVLEHPQFQAGDFDTNFIRDHFSAQAMQEQNAELFRAAALFTYIHQKENKELVLPGQTASKWKAGRLKD